MANEQHNDPLEEFFRKKVREYDIEYKEEDWLKLESRLDAAEADNKQHNYWKRYSAAAAIILLFSILAYYTYQQQQRIDQLNERLTRSEQVKNPQNGPLEILPDGLFDFSFPNNPSDTRSEQTLNTKQSSGNIAETTENNPGNSQNERNSNEESQQQFSTSDSYQQSIALAKLSESAQLSARDMYTDFETSDFTSNNLNPPNTIDRSTNTSYIPESSNKFNTQNQLPGRQTPRLTVGLMGGPDISTAGGISDFYDPGYKIGLSVEYNLTKNLALSVGAIHSKVQYTASGNDYSPPEGYWSYGGAPEETIGKCLLIDIPISLKYNVLHFDHSRLFATGGFSSYIMLNEDYRFTYDGYSSGQPQRWQERTGTRHWMSNAVFSLGYEVDLRKDISLRIEPFIKVPMQEVGWGNVKLYSMGSFISVNYNIF
ncbi:outer membrane beta-barrel protein [Fodinibius sp.]|uniref:outer membrane beta-barrel protein n=1 Tax=Fodinibius sp. TaxID=1872440 RepID=UPI002ACE7EC1|nr:outer membrane beta-barrel protein [Fodinibius sp.]MDZ7660267.1 outer membrane beta-barrel protein [Fodinibius sp.]